MQQIVLQVTVSTGCIDMKWFFLRGYKWYKYACKIWFEASSEILTLENFRKYEIDFPMWNGFRDMTGFVWKSCNS